MCLSVKTQNRVYQVLAGKYIIITFSKKKKNHSRKTNVPFLATLSLKCTPYLCNNYYWYNSIIYTIVIYFVQSSPVMTNLDSIFKSRDITLPTKVRLVKAMVFPVVMYGCENWTVKKAERRRIDAFELWFQRRLFFFFQLYIILLDLPNIKEKHQYSILTHIYGIQKDDNNNPVYETAKETLMYREDS